ncbi:Ig-like domain-containing protein [Sphingobacterium sp. LRF_L2]|uniref:Ig-like domain-containing protein n=1 Tax=Sphingobacterium sp. LRF_L2 TaxID=3369421 RepID=UPI003F60788B
MKYRYYITGRSGTRQVSPSNEGSLEFTFEKESNRSDFSRSLEGSITLRGEDFKWLYDLELTVYRFDLLTINIHKYCNGSWNEEWFEGYISLNSGEWNLDKCTVSLSIVKQSKYECFDLGKDDVMNLLSAVYPKVSVSAVAGTNTIVRKSFYLTFGPNDIVNLFPGESDPETKGWTKEKLQYQAPASFSNSNGLEVIDSQGVYNVTWVREEVYGTDALLQDGWISLGAGMYARRAVLYDYQQEAYNSSRPYDLGWSYKVLSANIDRGFTLRRSFEVLLSNVCPELTLESDFFQWNPVNESSINYVTGLTSKVRNLVLFQKSTVKRPFTSNVATKAEISLNDLLEDVCNIFQLEWEITDDGKFKIEHVSYKNRGQGLNVTTGESKALNEGKRQYSYDNDEIPKKEEFSWMDVTLSGDFSALPIIYTNPIAGKEKDQDSYDVKNITTDVMYCLENSDSENKNVSDDGFVLMACDSLNSILRESTIRGGNDLNNSLSWSHLHRDYWRYNRYMLNFKMNGVDTVALSVKPMKIQEQIKYRMCCDSDFDKEGLITTALGNNGILRSATFNLFREQIEMIVAFPAEGKLEENTPPVAKNDTAETFINTGVVIDILANDTDGDGVIIPSTLVITWQYRGVVQILDDFKVRFTPEAGFTGTALFRYTVRDNLGEISNSALVTITVNSGTSVPVANGTTHRIAKNLELSKGVGALIVNDTAATALTVISETKATAEGGTVVIGANGSFNYLAANDFVGLDTFEYTIRDNYSNQATGITTVNVFEPEPVYVRLVIDSRYENIHGQCGLGYEQNLGMQRIADITLKVFSDAQGTIPLDMDGYNMQVKLQRTYVDQVYNYTSQNTTSYPITTGSERLLFDDYVLDKELYACSGGFQERFTNTFVLVSDPSYTIIT